MMKKCAFIFTLLAFAAISARAADDDEKQAAAWARENLYAGKYQDAVDLLQKALPKLPEGKPERREASLVLIEALRTIGKLKEARELCDVLIKADPKDTEARGQRAEIDTDTGNYREALKAYDDLIAEDAKNERAWALRTNIYRVFSDRDGLKKTADHFFSLYDAKREYFNSDQVKDPREAAYLGLGIKDIQAKTAFEDGFGIAEELVEARKANIPEIYLWSAALAHEKYNFAFAEQRYKLALKLRPNLPDALAGGAAVTLQATHNLEIVEKLLKDAFDVNPSHVEAHLIRAALDLQEDRPEDAKKHLDAALAVNPNNLESLALLAAHSLDISDEKGAADAEKRALAINPRCADFYCDVGEAIENKRGFNKAAEFYKKAIAADPDHWRGYYGLGMNTSRQGAHGEEEGKALLIKAFEKNKFNLWSLNMIKVLDKIIGDKEQAVEPVYATSKTKHFTLKFFNKESEIVRPYLEEWAEKAYEWQTKKFGFEPQGPLTIELCHSFQDQAARTVGLPNLGALGVCFGKLCTVVSPREGRSNSNHPPFNWRKVLEHEFGHVMVLQMSDFKVPRWYTEAFSTYLEDDSRINSDRMMIDALARNKIKNIDDMNQYFRENMMMAYVHGRYVIEYIDKNHGFDAHVKAIKLFAEGKKVPEALQTGTGKSLSELNAGQLKFVKDSFADVRIRPTFDPARVVQLELAAKPDDASAQAVADLAIARLSKRQLADAESLAKRALEKDGKCVDAINVLGSIAFEKKDYESAKQHFANAVGIDPKRSFAAWQKLGVIYKKEGRTTKAVEAFEAARKSYPRYIGSDNPHHELPELYEDLEPPQPEKALGVWRDCVKVNSEDAKAALEGLKLAMKLKDFSSAMYFANAHIEIDPYKADVHRNFGKAAEAMKEFKIAAREFAVAVALEATDVESWVGVARMQKASGNKEEALKAVRKALEIDGTHAEAKALRTELGN